MKVISFENNEDWMEARRGKITGSRLKGIVVKRGTNEKIGYYELIAEKIAEPADDESPMERGHRLEEEAVDKFTEQTGIEVDTSLVIWQREDNECIAISPDGAIGDTGAVEVKCLSSARHVEAYITKKIPKDYIEQTQQYFIVNDKLETLHFVMYDPRMPKKLELILFELKREDMEDVIKELHEYQTTKLEEINKIVSELTF